MSEPTEKTEEAAPDEQVPNAVIVHRMVDEQGNIQTEVAPVGDVQVTEIQTILELGIKRFRQQAGL